MAFKDPFNVYGIGRLTRDPEIKYLPSGDPVVNFTLARNRGQSKDGSEKEAHFFNIVAFGKIAETIVQYTKKGSQVYIEGELVQDTWEDTEGAKRERIKIHASYIKFLTFKGKKKDDAGQPENAESNNAENFTDNDIPW